MPNWIQRFLTAIETHKGDASAHHAKTTAGELNLADMAEKAHGSLTGVTSDLHHPQAHKDDHDPIDGSDKLDSAAPVKVGAANAIGSSHSLARADHVHEREHAIYTHPTTGTCPQTPKAHNQDASTITSGRFPVDRLPAMTDEKIWKGTGANVEEVDVYTDAMAKTQAEGAKLDDHAAPDDNVDLDASGAKHGLMPKLDKTKLDEAASAATASKLVIRDASARAKFAAPGASGDALIKGTRVTTAELPAMTDEKIWKGTGANVEEVDVPAGATKEMFFSFGHNESGEGNFTGVYCSASAEFARGNFFVPTDFSSIISAVIVVIAKDTQASANWDILSYYAANGEAKDTHSESDTTSTYNVTDTEIFEVDISGILSGIAAGDYIGVKIINSTGADHRFIALGIRFKYS